MVMNRRSFLSAIQRRAYKFLGRRLFATDRTGHSLLCRILSSWQVAHNGPHGTFVYVDRVHLREGGTLCTFGVQCGEPKPDYHAHMIEMLENVRQTTKLLEKSGALQSGVWENPRFSVESLCNCGSDYTRTFSSHDPLCPFRIQNEVPITVDEYLRKPPIRSA